MLDARHAGAWGNIPRRAAKRRSHAHPLVSARVCLSVTAWAAGDLSAMQAPGTLTRDVEGHLERGCACSRGCLDPWAERNQQIVAMAILVWGGNLIESHAMEGAPMNAIETALLKAKSALRWRARPRKPTRS